ncbi:MAG: MFS transporter [Acidimicrobiia bacterium]
MSNERLGNGRKSQPGVAFATVMVAYVAVTLGESLLAPVLPVFTAELGLDTVSSARLLGVVSVAAGVGNLVGGWVLSRFTARAAAFTASALSFVGCLVAAAAGSEATFLAAQTVIGFAAGLYFAAGVFSVGALAPPGRKGRAMGRYGIAYSLGLAIAAGAIAVFGTSSWRGVYVGSAVLAGVIAVAFTRVTLPDADPIRKDDLRAAVGLLGAPVLVGGVAALAQFGLVAYIPTYAVDEWSLTASAAALVLFIGRVVSVPMKAVAGWMIDRFGAKTSARIVGVSMIGIGLVWLLSPVVAVGAIASILMASAAGAMFPMANVVAVERFGDLGGLLGVFRAAQMVIAGVSAWLVGVAAEYLGFTQALVVGTVALALILFVRPSTRTVLIDHR